VFLRDQHDHGCDSSTFRPQQAAEVWRLAGNELSEMSGLMGEYAESIAGKHMLRRAQILRDLSPRDRSYFCAKMGAKWRLIGFKRRSMNEARCPKRLRPPPAHFELSVAPAPTTVPILARGRLALKMAAP
jgi:hypothetical protein